MTQSTKFCWAGQNPDCLAGSLKIQYDQLYQQYCDLINILENHHCYKSEPWCHCCKKLYDTIELQVSKRPTR